MAVTIVRSSQPWPFLPQVPRIGAGKALIVLGFNFANINFMVPLKSVSKCSLGLVLGPSFSNFSDSLWLQIQIVPVRDELAQPSCLVWLHTPQNHMRRGDHLLPICPSSSVFCPRRWSHSPFYLSFM